MLTSSRGRHPSVATYPDSDNTGIHTPAIASRIGVDHCDGETQH